jgi:IclR family acetate operon transcriptional repressor
MALQLIEVLQTRKTLRVHEAATILGISPPTAYRFLSALRARGYATKDHQRVYHSTARVDAVVPKSGPRSTVTIVFPFLAELCEKTGQSVNYCVLEGNGVRSLVGVSSPSSLVGSRDGWLLPAYSTSAGQVLLANLPDEELRELYPLGLPSNPRSPDFDMGKLRRGIAVVRRRGWGFNDEVSERGIIGVAVPVRSPRTASTVGALALVASASQAKPEEVRACVPLLVDCAARIGDQLARG